MKITTSEKRHKMHLALPSNKRLCLQILDNQLPYFFLYILSCILISVQNQKPGIIQLHDLDEYCSGQSIQIGPLMFMNS